MWANLSHLDELGSLVEDAIASETDGCTLNHLTHLKAVLDYNIRTNLKDARVYIDNITDVALSMRAVKYQAITVVAKWQAIIA